MSHRSYPTDVEEQARTVVEAWKNIDPEFKVGDLTFTDVETNISMVAPLLVQIDSLETELVDLRNQRDALLKDLWDSVKRVRAAVKGTFGDDSSEYEMVGGTRLSERKRPTRSQDTALS